jgi:hypothetical protein
MVSGYGMYALEEQLRCRIGGVRLTGEDYLDGPPAIIDNTFYAFDVLEQKGGAFIFGKSPDKAYR